MPGRGDWDQVPRSFFSRCHLEEAGSQAWLSLLCGWLGRAGALAPAAGKALLGSGASFLGAGQRARPPALPGALVLWQPGGSSCGAAARGPCTPLGGQI